VEAYSSTERSEYWPLMSVGAVELGEPELLYPTLCASVVVLTVNGPAARNATSGKTAKRKTSETV